MLVWRTTPARLMPRGAWLTMSACSTLRGPWPTAAACTRRADAGAHNPGSRCRGSKRPASPNPSRRPRKLRCRCDRQWAGMDLRARTCWRIAAPRMLGPPPAKSNPTRASELPSQASELKSTYSLWMWVWPPRCSPIEGWLALRWRSGWPRWPARSLPKAWQPALLAVGSKICPNIVRPGLRMGMHWQDSARR